MKAHEEDWALDERTLTIYPKGDAVSDELQGEIRIRGGGFNQASARARLAAQAPKMARKFLWLQEIGFILDEETKSILRDAGVIPAVCEACDGTRLDIDEINPITGGYGQCLECSC